MIKLENISKSYKKIKVLKDISLTIKKGELVALIGPSGCGKTTTLKMINGLVKPSSGNIYIDGKSLLGEVWDTLFNKQGYLVI